MSIDKLLDQFDRDTRHLSVISQALKMPAAQRLREIGAPVISVIFRKHADLNAHLMGLLDQLVGDVPNKPEFPGNVSDNIAIWSKHWRTWAANNGYLGE